MAPTIEQVMLGIETRLKTISGLRVEEFAPDQINPPQAVIGVPPVPSYHATMGRGRFTLEPTVTIFVSKSWNRTGQLKLASYANPTGDSSVVTAIEADKTLGGVVDDCFVVDFQPLGLEEVGLIGYYGGVFTLRAIASGV